MKVLIAYGSKRGGTSGLAEMLAAGLRERGIEVEVEDASSARGVEGYDAVVVGGALYAMRWSATARRFVKRNARALRQVPVCFFSSGPLDDSATESEIPPTSQVRRLMRKVGATEHRTFGGRLEADATGFPAAAMAKDHAGDWRDPDAVRRWANHLADVLARTRVTS